MNTITLQEKENMIYHYFVKKMKMYYDDHDILYFYNCFQQHWRHEKLLTSSKIITQYNFKLVFQTQIDIWKSTDLKKCVKLKKQRTLKDFTTEELMQEIHNRNDIVIVGNWYNKEHIVDCCNATNEEASAFLDEVDTDNDGIREDARINLQTLFSDWKEAREQYCD